MSDDAWAVLACAWCVVYVLGLVTRSHYDQKRRAAELQKMFERWKQ